MDDRRVAQGTSPISLANKRWVMGVVAALGMIAARPGLAADRTWTGGDGAWSQADHWSDQAAPAAGDTVRLGGDKPLKITLDVDASIKELIFNLSGKASATLEGDHVLTLADGATVAKSQAGGHANQTISVPVTLEGAATLTNNDKWVRLANQLIFQSPISGDGTITITGKGNGGVALRADNANTFHGAIEVRSGMLIVGHAGALGDTAHGTRQTGGQIMFERKAGGAEPFTIAGKASWDTMGVIEQSGPIELESKARWTLDDDDSNGMTFTGTWGGPADSTIVLSAGNITLGGSAANTFAGTIEHASKENSTEKNALRLAKPPGVNAIAGALQLSRRAALLWQADDQIADGAPMSLVGGVLAPQGHKDRLGELTLAGRAQLDFAKGGDLHFANSAKATWKEHSQLLISNWAESGTRLSFGDSASAITPQQVAMIGFVDPPGIARGLYRGVIGADGAITPGPQAVMPVNPPYDVSDAARAERAKLYEIDGLKTLTGADTPLKKGMSIAFFGDSITWLNGYVSVIRKAIEKSPSTKDLGITLYNHGINGGGALQILDGSPKAAYHNKLHGGAQAPFAQMIDEDKTDIAVLFIGINDVWWRKTTPEDFRKQLTAIAEAARKHGTKLVVATMAVHGELPNGENKDDAKIEKYVQITRDVAKAAGAPLVDLRKAYIAYNRNFNGELQLDGSILSKPKGFLTYDGVHPTARGNELLANLISRGIEQAAREK